MNINRLIIKTTIHLIWITWVSLTSGTKPMDFIWLVKKKASCSREPLKAAASSESNVSFVGLTPSNDMSSYTSLTNTYLSADHTPLQFSLRQEKKKRKTKKKKTFAVPRASRWRSCTRRHCWRSSSSRTRLSMQPAPRRLRRRSTGARELSPPTCDSLNDDTQRKKCSHFRFLRRNQVRISMSRIWERERVPEISLRTLMAFLALKSRRSENFLSLFNISITPSSLFLSSRLCSLFSISIVSLVTGGTETHRFVVLGLIRAFPRPNWIGSLMGFAPLQPNKTANYLILSFS